ncbi:MAG: AI-2E family transporter [Pseudomonadota bacterium]
MNEPKPVSPSTSTSPSAAPRSERHVFYWLATVALVVAIFSRAQEILVPLALSIVIAFALSPAVKRLERRLGRAVAVALVVLVALAGVTAFGYLLKRQLVELSTQMTTYSDSMRRKVAALRGGDSAGLAGVAKGFTRLVEQLDQRVEENKEARPVKLVPSEATFTERMEATLAPVIAPLAKALIVLVLVVFLLAKREDLRDRFIRLIGKGKLTLTTRTLDEAGQRISRFLAHQTGINAGFGVIIALGLFGIGIPYPPLWGFVAAVLRFVPFVGTLLAMLFPALLAFVQFEGWWQTLATLGLFLGLDVLAAYLVEPIVIGAKTGVSSMAMLVSAIFWAWLWGPVGLVLSTPMTVCLAVLGRHVARLEYLSILLSDEPALEPEFILYQRLLAGDDDEAHEILERQFRALPPVQVFDQVIIPVLLLANRDRARDEIDEAGHGHVLRTIRALIDDEAAVVAAAVSAAAAGRAGSAAALAAAGTLAPPSRILGVAARSATDEAIWDMMARLFDPGRVTVAAVGSASLASEVTALVEAGAPDLVCVVATPPGGMAQTRYICKRILARLPHARILVIRQGVHGVAQGATHETTERLLEAGATGVAFTLDEALLKAQQYLSVEPAAPPVSPPSVGAQSSG